MVPDDISEMIEDWLIGDLSFKEVYSLCLALFEDHDVEDILLRLPKELREPIDSKLRADWDNDAPLEDCIIFNSGSGEHPATRAIVEKARQWLARHPKDPSGSGAASG